MKISPMLLAFAVSIPAAPLLALPSEPSGTAVEEAKNFAEDRDPGAVPGDGSTRREAAQTGETRQALQTDHGYGGTDIPNPNPPPKKQPNGFLKEYGPTLAGGGGGLLLGLGLGLGLAALGVGGPVVLVAGLAGLFLGLVIGHKFLGGLFGAES